MTIKTFAQFQRARSPMENINPVMGYDDEEVGRTPGHVYATDGAGTFAIGRDLNHDRYHLQIGRGEWTSASVERLEIVLWDVLVRPACHAHLSSNGAGVVEDLTDLTEEYQAFLQASGRDPMSADELLSALLEEHAERDATMPRSVVEWLHNDMTYLNHFIDRWEAASPVVYMGASMTGAQAARLHVALSGNPVAQAGFALARLICERWGNAFHTEQDINGGDVVEWLGELIPAAEALLAKANYTFLYPDETVEAVDDDNGGCDCYARSWYGDEHDTACRLTGPRLL